MVHEQKEKGSKETMAMLTIGKKTPAAVTKNNDALGYNWQYALLFIFHYRHNVRAKKKKNGYQCHAS